MKPTATIRRERLLAVLVAVPLALTGCAGATPDSSAPPTDIESTSETSATPQPATPASPPATSTAQGEPVAQRTAQFAKDVWTLKVYPPERAGGLVSLTFDVEATKVDDPQGSAIVPFGFLSSADSQFSIVSGSPNGIHLVDPVGLKRYRPATSRPDDLSLALCSQRPVGAVDQGDVFTITCQYAGLPTSLHTVTVQAGAFGSMPHVAIR